MKYEYKTLVLEVPRKFGLWKNEAETDSLSEIDAALKQMGDDGWQMVGVFPITNGGSPAQISMAIHYFMRAV